MSSAIRLKRKARGERPAFFADPNVDKVIAMVMGLAGEVAVMRDRLDTVERLLERTGALQRADIDAFRPDAAVVADRSAWREAFLGEVLRIVEIEVEALATGDQDRYDEAIALVEQRESAPAARASGKVAARGKKATAKKPPARKPAAKAKPKAPARVSKKVATRSAPKPAVVRRKAKPAVKKRARR